MCEFCSKKRKKIGSRENSDTFHLSREEAVLVVATYYRPYAGAMLEEDDISFKINFCPICGRNIKEQSNEL